MNIYIANFGSGNWAWPECLSRNAIAVMDDIRVHTYWQNRDHERYVAESMRLMKNRDGKPLDKGTATRWYNEFTLLDETSDDLWLHSDTRRLWWTKSKPDPVNSEVRDEPDPSFGSEKIIVYFKPCQPWSNRNLKGSELLWDALHAKAKGFLTNQGTFQPVLADNAVYVQALIDGNDLSSWHHRSEWKAKVERSGKGPVRVFTPAEIAAANADEQMRQTASRMISTARETALQSGQEIISATKDKRFHFVNDKEAQEYALELMREQKGRCALTGLALLLDNDVGDDQFRHSLDRIDSSGHYERGNLQVVCKFINKWKGAMDNEEFRRLIAVVRG